MKIVYIGSFRFPCFDAAAPRVLNNAKAMREAGHEVVFLSYGGEEREEDRVDEGFRYDGFEYHVTHEIDNTTSAKPLVKLVNAMTRGQKAWNLVEGMRNIDVLIGYNSSGSFIRRALRYCRKHSIKFVEDRTEWYDANEIPGGKWLPFYWIEEHTMKHTMRHVANKIVISHYLNRYYAESHNVVLPPLVDLQEEKWASTLTVVPEAIRSHQGKKLIFAGSPAKKDLLRNVVEALLRYRREGGNDIQLIVVGVKEENVGLYVSEEEQMMLGDCFVNVGRVSQLMVPAYYKLADFSLIIRESNRKCNAGFPTKMAESMAAGCPVVLTNTSDLSGYVQDGSSALFVEDCTSDAIYQTLIRISQLDDSIIVAMKRNAKEIGETCFDYRNHVKQVDDFLSQLKEVH